MGSFPIGNFPTKIRVIEDVVQNNVMIDEGSMIDDVPQEILNERFH